MAAFGDQITVGQLAVMGVSGDALQIPSGFWEPGTASIHKLHCGQGATAAPFSASLVVGPSATSPLSINTIGAEVLTGTRNCFGSDIKIGSNISLGAIDISYNALNSELNGLKGAVVPEWTAVTPKFDASALNMKLNSPSGKLLSYWDYNGTPLNLLHSHSDIRLKKDIKPIVGALDKILQLQGVSFIWNKDVSTYVGTIQDYDIGFIAQDVESIIPEVVIETSVPDLEYTIKNVRYERLVPLLIESIKEQQTQIEDLKSRLSRIESTK